MNLAANRFYKTALTKRYRTLGEVTYQTVCRYSYESHAKLYDVDIRDCDGGRTYHMNCGYGTEPNRFHRAIEAHFNL